MAFDMLVRTGSPRDYRPNLQDLIGGYCALPNRLLEGSAGGEICHRLCLGPMQQDISLSLTRMLFSLARCSIALGFMIP